MELYGDSVKLLGTIGSGTGDPLLTRDSTSSEVGTVTNSLGSLPSAQIFVGNGSAVATAVAVTGDITLSNAGVVAIASGVIVNADVNSSAAIAYSKLAALTASRALVSDGSGVVSVATTTATEIGYVNGVTSAIQTQIDGKQATITGAATTITGSDLTANRALLSNASGKVAVSSVTNTELGYVSGVTSAIQTQLNTKLTTSLGTPANGDIIYHNGTNWTNLPRGSNGQALYSTATSIQWDTPTINGIPVGGTANQVLAKQSGTDFDSDWETITLAFIPSITADATELNILDGATISTAELNFLDNASGNIQDQLNNKLSSSLTTNSIYVGVGGVATASTDLPTGTTIGAAAIYRAGGSDVALADGGTGASLADPNADRILFWDDSAGAVTWLEVGTNLTVTGTTLSASGGVSGLTTNRVPYATGATTLGDDSALTWDATNDALTVGVARIHSTGTNNYFAGETAGNFTLSGQNNVAIGGISGDSLTSGNGNTFVGYSAGTAVTSGANNTAIGNLAMDIGTGSANVAVGSNALGGATTGSSNVAIGTFAGDNISSGSSNVIIGTDIDAQSATASGQLSIQNAIFGSSNTATGTTVASGNLGFFATTWGGSAAKVIAVGSGTAPATSIVDGFQYYSGDIVAGNAAPHFMTEVGDIVKLYSISGWGTPSGTLTRTTFDSGTVTLAQLAERVAALITDLKTGHGLLKA